MSLPMDPVMRLSYANTQLRDNYESLDALCSDLDLDRKTLEESPCKHGVRLTAS